MKKKEKMMKTMGRKLMMKIRKVDVAKGQILVSGVEGSFHCVSLC